MRSLPRLLALATVLLWGPRLVSADVAKLASSDPAEAYKAVEEATRAKDLSTAGALFEAGLQTAYPHVAVACGEAIAALGPEAAKQADLKRTWDKASRSKDLREMRNLARVLGAWGDPGVDEELAYLGSGRRPVEVQAEALSMIGRLAVSKETPFPRCVAAVLSGLKSSYATLQMAACSAASRIKDPAFAEPLLELARKSQDKYSGLYAIWALIQMRKRGDLSGFIHVLESEAKRDTVNACLKAVTDLTGPEDVDALLGLSRSTKQDYRDAACIALGRIPVDAPTALVKPGAPVTPGPATPPTITPEGSKVVDRLLQIVETDAAWEVRDAASRAIQRIGEAARPQVAAKIPALVNDNQKDVSLAAIELAGVFRLDDAYKRLFDAALYDKDPVKRMFAARAIGLVNPGLVVEEMSAAIAKDRKGRGNTLHMVRALGYVRAEGAWKALVDIASNAEASEEMQAEAERALERLTGRRFGRKAERWNEWYQKAKSRDPFRPHLGRFDRKKNRSEAVEKRLYGLTETTERSVEKGLTWLVGRKQVEGSWDGNQQGLGGVIGCEPAYTGLSLLAFLGAGYNGASGKYHETIRRASEFLAATQFYDGGFPVTGGGDSSWIYAYLIGMGVWGINESYGQTADEAFRAPAQRGLDYLARVQTPGAGWRYGPRYFQSDSSCTSWAFMTMKAGALLGLEVPQKCYDGIDAWFERCQTDATGQEELPEDMVSDYDKEVGVKRVFKYITGYLPLGASEQSLQQSSMTPVGMVCRFFMGWQRSHPFEIGSANYLMDFLPQWRRGLEKGQAIAWYFYFYYYGTLAMHQMGGRYWRAWNEKIKTMLPDNQRKEPAEVAGSWDPDTAVLNGGRLFSTAMACMTLETYYRFSPLMLQTEEDAARKKAEEKAAMDGAMGGDGMGGDGMDDSGMDAPAMDGPAMDGAAMGESPGDAGMGGK